MLIKLLQTTDQELLTTENLPTITDCLDCLDCLDCFDDCCDNQNNRMLIKLLQKTYQQCTRNAPGMCQECQTNVIGMQECCRNVAMYREC